jgi:hypothetical protein
MGTLVIIITTIVPICIGGAFGAKYVIEDAINEYNNNNN